MYLSTQSLTSAKHAHFGHKMESTIDVRLMHQEGYHCRAIQACQDMPQNPNDHASLSFRQQPEPSSHLPLRVFPELVMALSLQP